MTSFPDPQLPDPERQPQFYDGVPAKRLLAWFIDMIAVIALCALVIPFTFFTGLLVLPFLFAVVNFLYRVAFLTWGSATPGMRFVAIELRDAQGARLDAGGALLHTGGFYLSCAIPIVQVISMVLMITGARGQGLTDLALGTVALNRRAEG